jgi:putative YphP/YqiW family bacilliredoxin
MPYDEMMVAPMRRELTSIGVRELRSGGDVDAVLKDSKGTVLVFVNSVCGCAAGGARPGLKLALEHATLPAAVTTVFAGQDVEATKQARSYFEGAPPSSPAIALFKDGRIVALMQRWNIEGRLPQEIAGDLEKMFDAHCAG